MTDFTGEAISADGLEELKAELARLEGEERRAIAARILSAREHGDLKENAEYHAAKEDQGHLETKILKLQQRLRNAVVVEIDAASAGVVVFGSKVDVVDEATGKKASYTIVGPTEADLKAGKLSTESPVAQALMGAAAGDVVTVQTPGGGRNFKIESLG